jgi:hypothetical protein
MNKVATLPDICTVRMDGELHESKDFVAILNRQTGDASILYNTDALSLGMAMKMIAKAFIECVEQCTLEEQKEIEMILGDAFMLERMAKDEQNRS